jgi:hypothetical protein
MAVELGTGYVTITASAKGIKQSIVSELQGVETAASTAGAKSGTSFAAKFSSLLGGRVQSAVGGQAQEVAGIFQKLNGESTKLASSQSQAGTASLGLATGLKVAAGAAAVFTAGKLVKFLGDSVHSYTDLASQVRSYQRVTGASAEESSKMVFALNTLGISADKGGTSMFRLAQRIGQGKVNLSKYGVEVKKTADGNVDLEGTLLSISDAYNATHDPAQRAALLMDSFGRSGKDLIPVLARGREGIKELFDEAGRTNHILDQGDLDRAKQFQLATHELSQTFEGLQVKAGNALTPFLTDITEVITDVVQLADKLGVFDAIGTTLQAGFSPVVSTIEAIKKVSDTIGLTQANTDSKLGQAQKYLADQQSKYADLVNEGNGKSAEALRLRKEIIAVTKYLGPAEKELADISVTAADRKAAAEERHKQAVERETQAIENRNNATIASFSSAIQAIQSTNQLASEVGHLNDGTAQSVDSLTLQQDALNTAGAKAQAATDNFEALNGRQATAQEKAGFFRQALIDLGNQFPQLIPLILGYIQKLDAIPPEKTTSITADTATAETSLKRIIDLKTQVGSPVTVPVRGGNSIFRAAGGPVSAGSPYIVGEEGWEVFVPDTSGTIIPHGAASTGAPIAAGGTVGTIQVAVQLDGQTIARSVHKVDGRNGVVGAGASRSKAFGG